MIIDSIVGAVDELALSMMRKEYYDCLREIDELKHKIKKSEISYDSLRTFRNVVDSDYDQYMSIRKQRLKEIAPLEAISSDCKTAFVYRKGCGNSLEGAEWGKTDAAFQNLIMSLATKQRQLAQLVMDMDLSKNLLESKAQQLKEKIQEAESNTLGENS